MKMIKDVLNVVLEDDHSPYGGVAFEGETVNDFMQDDIMLNKNDYVSELNKILAKCGTEQLKEF